jgi:elongation of very long chain fatty acids protein 7
MAYASVNQSTNIVDFYNELWEKRDRRLDDWMLMSSPWPTVSLSIAYWYCCLILGPTLMKDRPAFELKKTIQAYNVFQVALSAYIFIESALAGWFNHYSWVCQPVELGTHPDSTGIRMASACHLYFLSKFTEFPDTFFFIARKKERNVSTLQLIHHGIMPIVSYLLVRWLPGGHESFGGMFNALVHVIMYSYYFLAALGPHMQKYLWWKKYLTSFQMFQFVCVFLKSLVVIFGFAECGYPWQFSCVTASIGALFFGLFADFYIKEYNKKRQMKKHN